MLYRRAGINMEYGNAFDMIHINTSGGLIRTSSNRLDRPRLVFRFMGEILMLFGAITHLGLFIYLFYYFTYTIKR